ncbi:tail fiber domain-containing protein [Serratia liquefaciens]|uniref:tail fiber domain-containing protein n=1 Tax=Serratia liquefaciens TaxID=614 RepID=UPI0021C5DC0C|nr:tail fiber domain-containing protein [Serratia liquefaciens]
MPAGTLTLTNNSAVVKGAGTVFNTELKAGDMIVSVVGGVTYTLPVKTVDSATQATLIKAYDGPTQAGAAWSAVPRETLNAITAQLASETAKALRGLNYDKENWQQVFSGTGNITVKLPDGSAFTGPAWNSFTTALNLKAEKTEVDKKANKSDLGDSASRNVGTVAGTVAAGNDSRITNALQLDKFNDINLKNQGSKAAQTIGFWQSEGGANQLKSRISVAVGDTGFSYLSFMSNRPAAGSVLDVSFSINGNNKSVTTESGYLLQENGVRVYSPSNPGGSCDIKFKEVLSDTPELYAVPLIEKMKFVKFNYKEKAPNAPATMRSGCGLIAQDLERISDEFIRETVGEDRYKYPDIQNLLNLALKAIQEQQVDIFRLKEEITLLKEK